MHRTLEMRLSMKCLTIYQPWATLVVLGAKIYERRGWRTPFRGRVAIHAHRKFPEHLQTLCLTEPFRSVLRHHHWHGPLDLATGAIIGTAELVDCLLAEHVQEQYAFGDYSSGRWAWQFAEPIAFA